MNIYKYLIHHFQVIIYGEAILLNIYLTNKLQIQNEPKSDLDYDRIHYGYKQELLLH